MLTATDLVEHMKDKIRQWFLANPEEAKKEIAISLRASRSTLSIETAAAIAARAYETAVKDVAGVLMFGRAYGITSKEPQIDLFMWVGPDGLGFWRIEFLGGLDEDDVAFILADGHPYEWNAAREEYERTFPGTIHT
jgi:hypothetical protein